jgi:hypothetical protein
LPREALCRALSLLAMNRVRSSVNIASSNIRLLISKEFRGPNHPG